MLSRQLYRAEHVHKLGVNDSANVNSQHKLRIQKKLLPQKESVPALKPLMPECHHASAVTHTHMVIRHATSKEVIRTKSDVDAENKICPMTTSTKSRELLLQTVESTNGSTRTDDSRN